jgi:hypothetical protein
MPPVGVVRTFGTVTRLLVLALFLGLGALVMRLRAAQGEARMAELMELAGPGGGDGGPRCEPVVSCGPQLLENTPPVAVVGRAQACSNAAYLCEGLAARGPRMRVLRWADGHPPLRIVVEWPTNIAGVATMDSRHQQGAVRGLRAWSGLPLQLVVEAQPSPTDDDRRSQPRRLPASAQPDFTVQWQIAPYSPELGEAYTTWRSEGVRVTAATLPRQPSARGEYLTDRQIEAAAAHMMGHILGLPHSPHTGDVMYPGNTARTPSAEDRRALAALYSLPNGAQVGSEP